MEIFPNSSHRDGSIYRGTDDWKRIYCISDRNESKWSVSSTFFIFVFRGYFSSYRVNWCILLKSRCKICVALFSFTNWWRCDGTCNGNSCRMLPRGFIAWCLQKWGTSNHRAFGKLQLSPLAIVFVCPCHFSFHAPSPPCPRAQDSILWIVIHQALYLLSFQCSLIVQISPLIFFRSALPFFTLQFVFLKLYSVHSIVMFIFFVPHKSLFYENICDRWHHVLCYGVSFFLACMCA
jgi:hypothetical protein